MSEATLTDAEADPVGGVRATWWNAVFSLVISLVAAHVPVIVYLAAGPLEVDAVIEPNPSRLVLVGLVGLISIATQLAMVPWLRPGLGGGVASLPVAITSVAAGIVLWAALYPIGVGALPLVSVLSMIACANERTFRRGLFLAATGVAISAWVLSPGMYERLGPLLPLLTIAYPYLVFASVWAWDIVTRLDLARRNAADLAVARERLRFASDLHDIQGHSLQVIALKAELAERLLDARPEAAAEQIAEVRHEAAEALTQTRELARGYRSTPLQDELNNARDVLTEAGFDCTTEIEDLPRDVTIRSLFGRALREATTNVLRHATAGPVGIEVRTSKGASGRRREWTLRVVNAAEHPWSESDAEIVRGDGSGLAGLAQRAERMGGTVVAEITEAEAAVASEQGDDVPGARRFCLTVTVPALERKDT